MFGFDSNRLAALAAAFSMALAAPALAQSQAASHSHDASAPAKLALDYYMETHWDRTEFDSKISEYQLSNADFNSNLDAILPAQMSPGVRSALNLGLGVTSGIIDAALIWPMGCSG